MIKIGCRWLGNPSLNKSPVDFLMCRLENPCNKKNSESLVQKKQPSSIIKYPVLNGRATCIAFTRTYRIYKCINVIVIVNCQTSGQHCGTSDKISGLPCSSNCKYSLCVIKCEAPGKSLGREVRPERLLGWSGGKKTWLGTGFRSYKPLPLEEECSKGLPMTMPNHLRWVGSSSEVGRTFCCSFSQNESGSYSRCQYKNAKT